MERKNVPTTSIRGLLGGTNHEHPSFNSAIG
jgi:hypothetical protein